MYSYKIVQSGKSLKAYDANGVETNKIVVNKFENKETVLNFEIEDNIPIHRYLIFENPVDSTKFYMLLSSDSMTITSTITRVVSDIKNRLYWKFVLIASEKEIDTNNIDQTAWTYISNDFILIVKDNISTDTVAEIQPDPNFQSVYDQVLTGVDNLAQMSTNATAQANLAKQYAENSYSASLVAIEKEYLSSQSAESASSDKTSVSTMKADVLTAKTSVEQTALDFNSQKGVANGLASLDANGKVIQTSNNSDKLNNHADTYFATVEGLNNLTNVVNSQVADLTYNPTTGVLTKTVNAAPSNIQLVGLLSSVTEDTLGNVTFTMKDGSSIVWHKGKDNFVSSSYYDTETQELVMVMVSGSEVRIPVSGLIDVYTGGLTDNVNITVDGHTIFADVIVSADIDNILEERTTGLYVPDPKNQGYKTLTENNLLYLGIDATAKNSEKLGGKLEGELNVANADTADKLTSAKTITLSGAVSGTVSTDLSGNVDITTKNEILGYHVVDVASLTDYIYNWDVTEYNSLIIVSNTAIKINFVNLVGGFVGTIHYYSDDSTGLDEAYLATQGFVLDNDIYGLITKTTVDQCYHYYFDYDSVKKSVSRMVK